MTKTWPIEYRIDSDENGNKCHLWTIVIDGEQVAELWADTDIREIRQVWTHQNHREQGMATALYHAAMAQMTIWHAPESHRTPDGNRFATRVGGPTHDTCDCCNDL